RSGSSSLARDTLRAFARSQASQAEVDHVMRPRASHDSWLGPVAYAERAWAQPDFDQTIQLPDAAPNPGPNACTDVESAPLADRQPIGPYGGPVDGVTLLGALESTIEALLVNPASPREQQWFVAAGGFEIARGWASAIAVERALAERGNGPVPVAQLRAHRFYLLVEKATQSITKVSLPDIDGVVAVCFTANDRIEEYVASLPPQVRPMADFAPIEGPNLFELLRGMSAAGVIINAGSDDQTALTGEDIAAAMR